MKKKLYSILCTIFFLNIVQAQIKDGGAAFIQTGYLNAPNTKTLTQLSAGDYLNFSNHFLLFGVNGFYREKKSILAAECQFGFQKTYAVDNRHTGLVYESVLGSYGRILSEEKNFWIYPSCGAGVSVISLKNYTIANQRKHDIITYSLVNPAAELAMNANILLSKLHCRQSYYLGWLMGVKAGYRLTVKSSKWKTDDDRAIEKKPQLPTYVNNAFNITVSFGMGTFNRNNAAKSIN